MTNIHRTNSDRGGRDKDTLMTSASEQPPKKKRRARPRRPMSFRDFMASRRSKAKAEPTGVGAAPDLSSGVAEPVGGAGQQSGGSEVVVNHVLI